MKNLAQIALGSLFILFFASCEPEELSEYESSNIILTDDFEEIGETANQKDKIDDDSRSGDD